MPGRRRARPPRVRAARLDRGGATRSRSTTRFPEWGDSRYVRLRLTGTVRLADALNQLYVLLPVLDDSKHYWQGPDEVDKLLRSGEGWLADHPDAEPHHPPLPRTARRSDPAAPRPARRAAVTRSRTSIEPAEDEEIAPAGGEASPAQHPAPRGGLQRAHRAGGELGDRPRLRSRRSSSSALLVKTPTFTRIAGTDVSTRSLQHRRPPAAARPDARAAGRPHRAVPVRAHLRGRPLRRLRRRRADGGRSSTSTRRGCRRWSAWSSAPRSRAPSS